jgi:NO-binding membrane sensor protein with MHYT domain/two-component sensor histidine kinase
LNPWKIQACQQRRPAALYSSEGRLAESLAILHHHHHDWTLVCLSLLVAVFGSWVALDLASRVQTHLGRARLTWTSTAAIAMGLSIWSMHFIAMLGFDPGVPVVYAPGLTALSLVLAISSTWGAFIAATRPGARSGHVLLAGAAMGLGICAMHYVGMAALRTAMTLDYRPGLVALSLAIAIVASTIGLFVARQPRTAISRLLAASLLGVAVVGMHYTAMAALELTPIPGAASMASMGVPPFLLGVGVAAGTLLVLFLAIMASLYDQRGNILQALDAGGVGYWEYDLRSQSLQASSQVKALFDLRGDEDLTLEHWLGALSPEDRTRRDRAVESAQRTGGDYDHEYQLLAQDRWVNVRGKVIYDQRGRAVRMIGVVLDVTDRHEAFAAVTASEQRHRLLTNELNHRVKNTLATIQSIASQTARGAASLSEFRRAFEDRLMALSATHNVLTQASWEAAEIGDLLAQEMAPYPAEQVTLVGPSLRLPARHALALGMVLHELATNAAKYGALSTPNGRLDVQWATFDIERPEPMLVLEWRETGGPAVSPPTKAGFGSRLIKVSVEKDLGGAVALDFAPTGLVCRIEAPLQPISESPVRLDA